MVFFETFFSKLPFDIIREILLYNRHFIVRNKKVICIHQISKEDYRFSLYNTVSKIYQQGTNSWWVVLGKQNKKYIIKHCLRPNLIWEYSFLTFSKDIHTNIIGNIPDSSIPYG
jgi:hypothetical protein